MASSNRPRVEVEASMAGGFPTYYDQQDHHSGQTSGMTSETETTSSRSSDRPAPSKGILKSAMARQAPDPLAARFYRVGRPEPMHHSPTYPPVTYGHDDSWHHDSNYDSYELDSCYDHETDSQSASSELSINTQATSIASDETVTDPGSPSNHKKHVRHVPPPTVARVKARPRARPTSTELTKAPPQKRQVNIQIFPPGSSSNTQELSLSRKAERDLLDRIDELEHEAEGFRNARVNLNKELVDTADKLSLRVHEAKDLHKSLSHERSAKELLARELQEQRHQLDEFRSNFNLQRAMLEDSEKEKDLLKATRNTLERQVQKLEQQMTTQETHHKELEVNLVRKAAELERTTKTLEDKFGSQTKQLKDLESLRQSLQNKVDGQEKQLKQLNSLTTERDNLKSNIEKQQQSHVEAVKKINLERDTLETKLKDQEKQLKEHKDLMTQRDSLKSEVEGLQKQVKTLTDQQETLESEKKRLEESEEQLKGRVEEVEGEKHDLETEIEDLKDEIEELKGEVAAFKTQIDELENAKEDLQEEVETTKKEAKELVEAEKKNTETLVEAEKSKLAESEKQAAIDKAELEVTVAGLKTDLQGAKDANVVIVSERLEIKTKLGNVSASLAAAQDEVKGLQERNKALESDIESTKTQVTNLEAKSAEFDKLVEQRNELEERATNLQADIVKRAEGDAAVQAERDQLKADKAELEALKEKLEDASAVTKLTEEKAALEGRTKELEAQAEALKAEEARLKAEVEALKGEAAKVPALTEQHRAISAQLAAVTQDLEQARAASDSAAGLVRELQAQINKLQARSKSRSGSRSKKHDRSRSTGLVFVRNPADKGAGIFVTTREALRASEQG